MADQRRPLHIGVVVGVSASVYALSLAAVTGFESARTTQADAASGPAARTLDQLSAAHTDMERRLAALTDAYNAAASSYGDAAAGLGGYEQGLGQLAGTVDGISGSVGTLPSNMKLPAIPRAAAGRAPTVHACTTASGRPC
jgi:hypothetical protein